MAWMTELVLSNLVSLLGSGVATSLRLLGTDFFMGPPSCLGPPIYDVWALQYIMYAKPYILRMVCIDLTRFSCAGIAIWCQPSGGKRVYLDLYERFAAILC